VASNVPRPLTGERLKSLIARQTFDAVFHFLIELLYWIHLGFLCSLNWINRGGFTLLKVCWVDD
jgi:hypothetical protein